VGVIGGAGLVSEGDVLYEGVVLVIPVGDVLLVAGEVGWFTGFAVDAFGGGVGGSSGFAFAFAFYVAGVDVVDDVCFIGDD